MEYSTNLFRPQCYSSNLQFLLFKLQILQRGLVPELLQDANLLSDIQSLAFVLFSLQPGVSFLLFNKLFIKFSH